MKTVLVADDDLAFLFWLGQTLETAGYNVIPAPSIPEAHSLLSDLAVEPELMIINPALPASAEFIDVLSRDQPGLHVVAAVDEGVTERNAIFAGLERIRKPQGLILGDAAMVEAVGENEMNDNLDASRAEWLLMVQRFLEGRVTSTD